MKLFTFIICTVLCSNIALGQQVTEVTAEEFPTYIFNRNECFDGGSLWGYMNGGADIYLEYGFDILRVEEFSNEKETIKLELFKMIDPISAFGIYSIKTFKCDQSEVNTTINCLNKYQLQLLSGDYYIQLINESGSEEAKQAMISLAEILHKKIEPKELVLPLTCLTDSLNFSLDQIKMVKGDLGVHNKAMYLEDCFKGIEDYQVYLAKKVVAEEKVKYYEIVFDNPKMKNEFIEINRDKELQIIGENEVNILIQN